MKTIKALALITFVVGAIGCDQRGQETSTDKPRGYVSQSEILERSKESRRPAQVPEEPKQTQQYYDNTSSESDEIEFESYRGIGE